MVDAGREAAVSRPQPANRVLIIVSRANPAQHNYLKHAFEREAIEVILDRRVGPRRQSSEKTGVEKRRRDRRRRDITDDLTRFGWAVVRR